MAATRSHSSGRAAWAHDWFSNVAVSPSFLALPGAWFLVNDAAPPHDVALVTAGAEWRLSSNWSLMGRFDGEFQGVLFCPSLSRVTSKNSPAGSTR